MFLGVALMLCAVLLYLGARTDHAVETAVSEESWSDFAIAGGWSVFYALVLVGNMPFAVATAIYLVGFTGWFLWHEQAPREEVEIRARRRGVLGDDCGRHFVAVPLRIPGAPAVIEILQNLGAALGQFLTPVGIFHVAWGDASRDHCGQPSGPHGDDGRRPADELTYTLERDTAILVLICYVCRRDLRRLAQRDPSQHSPARPPVPRQHSTASPRAAGGRRVTRWRWRRRASALGHHRRASFFWSWIAPAAGRGRLALRLLRVLSRLAVFGIVISGQLTGNTQPLKGYIAGILGLMVAMIGSDGIHAHVRFNLGISDLNGGIGLIPAMVGAFGFAEVLTVMWRRRAKLVKDTSLKDTGVAAPLRPLALQVHHRPVGDHRHLQSASFRAVGEDIGAWASYATAKRLSRKPGEYGNGSMEGLTAAETGNSAVVPGSLIPALTLAVPGSAPAAVLIAALFIHGIRPGPMIMIEQPTFIFSIAAMAPARDRRHRDLRALAHAALHSRAAHSARIPDAARLRPLRHRTLCADPADLRDLG